MKKIIILTIVSVLGSVFGQSGWDAGNISFGYGNPFPNETVNYAGSFVSTDIPSQGVGGFEVTMGDTNFLSLVAYDIHVSEGDTLADIFAIIIQDTVAIETGFHIVGFGTGSIKLFLWMQDVDPSLVLTLIDTAFTLDSLDILDPYLSLSGQIEITEISNASISGNFAGAMINTGFDLLMVSDGTFSLSNTLPEFAYNYGSLAVMANTNTYFIEGELNPVQSSQGVGGAETWQGDTLTTTIFAYAPTTDGTAISVYGITFRALEEDYPGSGMQLVFTIGNAPDDLPMALPFYLENASLEQLVLLLAMDSIPGIDAFENLYLPAQTGIATLGRDLEGEVFAALPGILMINTSGSTIMMMEDWSLTSSSLTSIDQTFLQQPYEISLAIEAFPNPFNSSTVIPFRLDVSQSVNLTLYNMLGQQVAAMPMGVLGAGSHRYHLNLGPIGLSSGLYYFRLISDAKFLGAGSFIYLK